MPLWRFAGDSYSVIADPGPAIGNSSPAFSTSSSRQRSPGPHLPGDASVAIASVVRPERAGAGAGSLQDLHHYLPGSACRLATSRAIAGVLVRAAGGCAKWRTRAGGRGRGSDRAGGDRGGHPQNSESFGSHLPPLDPVIAPKFRSHASAAGDPEMRRRRSRIKRRHTRVKRPGGGEEGAGRATPRVYGLPSGSPILFIVAATDAGHNYTSEHRS